MKSLYDDTVVATFTNDLDYRVYTSRLLGRESSLVLDGSGNSSIKSVMGGENVLYIKGRGCSLTNISINDFSPVKLDVLREMATFEKLSDTDMMLQQIDAMIDKTKVNPSVKAIIHAIIPYKYVEHTQSDAVITISNSENGIENIKELYSNYLIIPYVMPGFKLVQTIYNATKNIDWNTCEGIIIHNHGIFTFDDDPKISYEKMIEVVNTAEEFLNENAQVVLEKFIPRFELDIEKLLRIISKEKGYEAFIKVNQSPLALHYASQRNLNNFAKRGVLIPEHIIRTKRNPMILEDDDIQKSIDLFEEEYLEYYNEFTSNETMLNPTPNWAVIKNYGTVSFGANEEEATIIENINNHTMKAVLQADMLGGYVSINLEDCFEMEYWELEQSKLKK